ncbi:MAG: RNA polymerase sigma factor [Elusimicrobia bacterium]|nr:RNA polymerase sigma factor [Elusimicrobiota bacterium]
MLERLIEQYSPRGYQFAYHLCGNDDEARELLQESFFKVLRGWGSYRDGQPLENWFLTILRHVYYDKIKRFDSRHSVSMDAPLSGYGAEEGLRLSETLCDAAEGDVLESLERQELREQVLAAMESLSLEQKAVLTLSDIQGLSYDQISEVLDCPAGTVRSRLCRARKAFKRRIMEEIGEVAAVKREDMHGK